MRVANLPSAHMNFVQDEVHFLVEDSECRVFVKETGFEVQILSKHKPFENWDPNSIHHKISMDSNNQAKEDDDVDGHRANFGHVACATDDVESVKETPHQPAFSESLKAHLSFESIDVAIQMDPGLHEISRKGKEKKKGAKKRGVRTKLKSLEHIENANCSLSKPIEEGRMTNNSSENLNQLAREALHIGEVLGVSVIEGKDAAIERITTRLKKEKKSRRSSNQAVILLWKIDVPVGGPDDVTLEINMDEYLRKGKVVWNIKRVKVGPFGQ
ncbi:hypothetical protein Cgig2_010094 [Carnegiea gigantea]|uniref:Uncharacterized protein n=1 Tax=Carnegiea gigantea TaxID=171969 RepID=A0A9Q1K5L5_9CARY|nr:hypothetical protein Cgig2_010094 [Carnegiea gigantea]